MQVYWIRDQVAVKKKGFGVKLVVGAETMKKFVKRRRKYEFIQIDLVQD